MLKTDYSNFMKDMNNILQYSFGFLDGVEQGKAKMFDSLGEQIKDLVGDYIDSSAMTNPSSLHHVYEWYQTGSAAARLFDIDYVVRDNGISFNGTLSQSKSVKEGSSIPFYNKASIMESGASVTIRPRLAKTLAFEVDGETVFSKKPITVSNPGGNQVQGSFHDTFKEFFVSYLSQALIDVSGLMQNASNPIDFKINLNSGKSGGRSVGVRVGAKWISKGGTL